MVFHHYLLTRNKYIEIIGKCSKPSRHHHHHHHHHRQASSLTCRPPVLPRPHHRPSAFRWALRGQPGPRSPLPGPCGTPVFTVPGTPTNASAALHSSKDRVTLPPEPTLCFIHSTVSRLWPPTRCHDDTTCFIIHTWIAELINAQLLTNENTKSNKRNKQK